MFEIKNTCVINNYSSIILKNETIIGNEKLNILVV